MILESDFVDCTIIHTHASYALL